VTGMLLLSEGGVDGGVRRRAWSRELEVKLWGIGIEREGVPSAAAPESLSADSVGSVSASITKLRMRWCCGCLPFSISISSLGAFGCCASASSFADNLSLRAASTGPNTLLESAWLFFLVRLALSPLAILCEFLGLCCEVGKMSVSQRLRALKRNPVGKRGDQKPKIRYCGGGPNPGRLHIGETWTLESSFVQIHETPFVHVHCSTYFTQQDFRLGWEDSRLCFGLTRRTRKSLLASSVRVRPKCGIHQSTPICYSRSTFATSVNASELIWKAWSMTSRS
jgi:hypothetical protein